MKRTTKRVLVAGATGYLGSYIVNALKASNTEFTALARNTNKLTQLGLDKSQIRIAEVTDPESLYGCCQNIDVVISCVGITKQKDGLSYMDVDYQANCNLLEEAQNAGVKKFIYISAFNAPNYLDVRLLKAKETFAAKLLKSPTLEPCVIRPNGFFSDLEAFYDMAKSGRAYVFGQGAIKLNPIHGSDLARFCLENIEVSETELSIGGPEILSMSEIADIAFRSQKKKPKITYLPDWFRKAALFVASSLPERLGGPSEFFLTVSERDMVAPVYGEKTLYEHFSQIHGSE